MITIKNKNNEAYKWKPIAKIIRIIFVIKFVETKPKQNKIIAIELLEVFKDKSKNNLSAHNTIAMRAKCSHVNE